MKFAC